jgi:hypothetical protein
VETVQPAGILGKRAFPRDRHGKEKRLERGVIETLAEIAPGRDNDAFLGLGNRGETRGDVAALLLALPTLSATAAMMWMVKRFTSGILDNLRKVGPDKKVGSFCTRFPTCWPQLPHATRDAGNPTSPLALVSSIKHPVARGCAGKHLSQAPAMRCDWLVPNRQYDTL